MKTLNLFIISLSGLFLATQSFGYCDSSNVQLFNNTTTNLTYNSIYHEPDSGGSSTPAVIPPSYGTTPTMASVTADRLDDTAQGYITMGIDSSNYCKFKYDYYYNMSHSKCEWSKSIVAAVGSFAGKCFFTGGNHGYFCAGSIDGCPTS